MQEIKRDNFDIVEQLLNFKDKETFYYIVVTRRGKDTDGYNRNFKSYTIDSIERFHKLKPEIITMCEAFEARAYFYIRPRNKNLVMKEYLLKVAQAIGRDSFTRGNEFYSACGSTPMTGEWTVKNMEDSKEMAKEYIIYG